MERVCVFIDGSNLYHGLKYECGNVRIDFARFVERLIAGRQLVRAYYYNAVLHHSADQEAAKNQQRFLESIRKTPYFDVRLGRMEPRGGTFVEKGIDVAIAVDMLSMAFRNIYDAAVLVSSDGDFVKAVHAVQETGKHVEVACFAKAYHLRQTADKVIILDKRSLDGLWIPNQ